MAHFADFADDGDDLLGLTSAVSKKNTLSRAATAPAPARLSSGGGSGKLGGLKRMQLPDDADDDNFGFDTFGVDADDLDDAATPTMGVHADPATAAKLQPAAAAQGVPNTSKPDASRQQQYDDDMLDDDPGGDVPPDRPGAVGGTDVHATAYSDMVVDDGDDALWPAVTSTAHDPSAGHDDNDKGQDDMMDATREVDAASAATASAPPEGSAEGQEGAGSPLALINDGVQRMQIGALPDMDGDATFTDPELLPATPAQPASPPAPPAVGHAVPPPGADAATATRAAATSPGGRSLSPHEANVAPRSEAAAHPDPNLTHCASPHSPVPPSAVDAEGPEAAHEPTDFDVALTQADAAAADSSAASPVEDAGSAAAPHVASPVRSPHPANASRTAAPLPARAGKGVPHGQLAVPPLPPAVPQPVLQRAPGAGQAERQAVQSPAVQRLASASPSPGGVGNASMQLAAAATQGAEPSPALSAQDLSSRAHFGNAAVSAKSQPGLQQQQQPRTLLSSAIGRVLPLSPGGRPSAPPAAGRSGSAPAAAISRARRTSTMKGFIDSEGTASGAAEGSTFDDGEGQAVRVRAADKLAIGMDDVQATQLCQTEQPQQMVSQRPQQQQQAAGPRLQQQRQQQQDQAVQQASRALKGLPVNPPPRPPIAAPSLKRRADAPAMPEAAQLQQLPLQPLPQQQPAKRQALAHPTATTPVAAAAALQVGQPATMRAVVSAPGDPRVPHQLQPRAPPAPSSAPVAPLPLPPSRASSPSGPAQAFIMTASLGTNGGLVGQARPAGQISKAEGPRVATGGGAAAAAAIAATVVAVAARPSSTSPPPVTPAASRTARDAGLVGAPLQKAASPAPAPVRVPLPAPRHGTASDAAGRTEPTHQQHSSTTENAAVQLLQRCDGTEHVAAVPPRQLYSGAEGAAVAVASQLIDFGGSPGAGRASLAPQDGFHGTADDGTVGKRNDVRLDCTETSRNLSELMLAAHQLKESLLETRVAIAMSTNRLIRLDNPILRERLLELRRRADQAKQQAGLAGHAGLPKAAGRANVIKHAVQVEETSSA